MKPSTAERIADERRATVTHRARPLTPDATQRLVSAFVDGVPVSELKQRFGVSAPRVIELVRLAMLEARERAA